jgi:hypothetical protein
VNASLRQILEWLLAAVVAATFVDDSTAATTYAQLDRLDQRNHLGVFVWSPATGNSESTDGASTEWLTDTVAVVLSVGVPRTPGQIEMLLRAGDHEERIRHAVCSDPMLQPHQPVFTGTTRELSADRAWLTVTQNFRIRRFESVRS